VGARIRPAETKAINLDMQVMRVFFGCLLGLILPALPELYFEFASP
jgi:hypothetical protein